MGPFSRYVSGNKEDVAVRGSIDLRCSDCTVKQVQVSRCKEAYRDMVVNYMYFCSRLASFETRLHSGSEP